MSRTNNNKNQKKFCFWGILIKLADSDPDFGISDFGFTLLSIMEEESKQISPGERPVDSNLTEKRASAKDESTGSGNPSPDTDAIPPSTNITNQLGSSYTCGPLTTLSSQEHTYFYGGHDNNRTDNWDDYHRFTNANNLQVVSPAMFNENASLLFHSGYGIDSQMAYRQFSPMASPLSPIMVDGQLYSPHQYPVAPSFLPQAVSPGLPHVTSHLPFSQNVASGNSGQEGLGDNVFFGTGSGYFVPFGSFGEGGLAAEPLSNRPNTETGRYPSQLTPSAVFPQSFGILGPFEQHVGQFSLQQRPSRGIGTMTSSFAQNYPHSSSYQSLNYSAVSPSNWRVNNQSRLTPDQSGRRDRDRNSVFISDDSYGDRNRGPRALKPKINSSTEEISSSVPSKNGASVSESNLDLYNQPDFVTDYENAKFFVIKSYSEDNVHKSIKYQVWASTPLGNRKLDAAYRELKEMKSPCPLFLLFSVNASGQFCGVAEMIGPVDFENDADYWQQDRWNGQFPVWWHIIKDVPNSRFRHMLLENNDNKPVTHSRDTQEVKLEQGIEMLKIFKEHEVETSILDDFSFYDERERILQEKRTRQQPRSSEKNNATDISVAAAAADVSMNQLSDRFTEALQLEDGKNITAPK